MREQLYAFVRLAPDRWHFSLIGNLRVIRSPSSVELALGHWYFWISRRRDDD